MSVIADPVSQTLTCYVPPCLAGTPAGTLLAERMLAKDFKIITDEDIGEHLLKAMPPGQFHKMEQRLGLREAPEKVCSLCNAPRARSKCTGCLRVYYCSVTCQTNHWKEHKPKCRAPQRIASEHNCVAVPDYQCFHEYTTFYSGVACTVGIMILNRDTFEAEFGDTALYRTCLSLALDGKPALMLLKTLGGAQ